MRNALVIVAKAPVVGQVKTRLCPPLSAVEAAGLFRCFLADTAARACTVPEAQVCLAFTPAESEDFFRALLPFPLRYFPQRGNGLGERLINIFSDLLDDGFTHVVIMDSDSPTLPMAYVQAAFTLLGDGARAVHRQLFENITWSTSAVLTETLEQARLHRLSIALLPPWYDVDNGADLHKLAAELSQLGDSDGVPRTRAFLTQLRLYPEDRRP